MKTITKSFNQQPWNQIMQLIYFKIFGLNIIMRKNKKNKRFIESCYYKFKVHRSLSTIKHNPLLVPNMLSESSLYAAATKKQNQHFHNMTFSNWIADFHLNSSQIKKNSEKISSKQKNKFQDSIVVLPIKYINQTNKLKIQSHIKQLKQQRKKIFRIDCQAGQNKINKQKIHDLEKISTLPQFTHNANYNRSLRKNEISLQKINNVRYDEKFNKTPFMLLRKIPNKRYQSQSQQFLKNQSNIQFSGWDLDSTDHSDLITSRNQKNIRL